MKHAGEFKTENDLNASLSKRELLVKQGSLVQKLIYSNEDINSSLRTGNNSNSSKMLDFAKQASDSAVLTDKQKLKLSRERARSSKELRRKQAIKFLEANIKQIEASKLKQNSKSRMSV